MVSFGRIEFSIGVGVAGLLLLATYLWLDSTSTSGAKVGHEYSNLLSELQKQQHHLLSEMKKQHDEVLKAMNSQHDDQTRLLIHQQSVALNQSEGAVVPPVFMTNQHSVQEQIHKLASEQIEWLQKLQAAVTQLREVNGTAEHEAMSTALVQHFEVLYQMHSMLEPIVNQSIVINKDKPIKPPPQREIYISIIMVLRNDDYGGNMGGRLSNWLELFSYEANAVGLSQDVEVIFVEWNPVPNKPLVDLMKTVLPADKKFPIRIITVPNEVHKTITNPNGIEVYEYMAKNVGIRRAKGKFILCTNPDSLFNPEIVGFLAKRKLSEKAFYTMFRTFDSWGLPSGSTQQKLDALISKTRHDHGHGGDALGEELCKNGFIEENKFPQRSWPVDDAPGDFYMISREGAFSFRGFSQRNQNFNLDSYILCMSLSHGFAQLVPKAPCLLAHQAHNRPPSYGYVTPGWNANSFCGNLLNTKNTPYPPEDNGGENWGWADTTFPQVTL